MNLDLQNHDNKTKQFLMNLFLFGVQAHSC